MSDIFRIFFAILCFLFIGISIYFFSYSASNLNTAPSLPDKLPDFAYPNKELSPGVADPTATKEAVCTSGYSKTHRDVSVTIKKKVYQEYGVQYPQPKVGMYEVDHVIPLELGGSNDIKNLFLEPAEPRPGFHEKDVVENYLHSQVCDYGMDLVQAQQLIVTDWYAVYKQIKNPEEFKFNN